MPTQVGIWMDKRVAKIMVIDEDRELMTTVESSVEEFHPKGGSGTRFKGGPQDVVQDSKYLERKKHQFKDYFNEVIKSLPKLDYLLVFGPAQTGQKFEHELATHHKDLYKKLIGVETVDSLTDNQLFA